MKLYFTKDSLICYPISFWYNYIKDSNIFNLELFQAKKEKGTGHFFCSEFNHIGETGSCGVNNCHKYNPRNGKNGICKHHRGVYTRSETVKVISQ